MTDLHAPLPPGPFDVILADPPWSYYIDNGVQGTARAQYPTMTAEQLRALPVEGLAAPTSILVMWCTWPKLDEGMALVDAWGFTHKTGLPWIKTNPKGSLEPFTGLGWWLRGCSEPVLIATRGKPKPPDTDHRYVGVIGWEGESWSQPALFPNYAPRSEHSRKPADIHALAEAISHNVGQRRLELFARRPKQGWEVWGNEI